MEADSWPFTAAVTAGHADLIAASRWTKFSCVTVNGNHTQVNKNQVKRQPDRLISDKQGL